MRGENHFRVKGENIGQPEVIFRKISFSVIAKHAEKGENDFLKSFSPKTNTPLIPRICYENVMNVALLTKRRAIHKMFHNIVHDCPPFTTTNTCFYVGFVIDFAQYLRDASK